jgi:histidyl-tRNA synthetase
LELRTLLELADSFGLGGLLSIDFGLVRGLDYYTGPVFEVKAGGAQVGSVAGGGRYDGLIERFGGASTPATGISLGVERLYEVLMERLAAKVSPSGTVIFVANVNEITAADATRISRKLMEEGIPAESDIMGRKLGRQLEYANSKGIPFVLIVGPEELRSGRYKIKDMGSKREFVTDLEGVAAMVKKGSSVGQAADEEGQQCEKHP